MWMYNDCQVFARKVVRPRSVAAVDEIENEIRAVERFCHRNENPNLVVTFRTGVLDGTPYYFIDMELCDYDLETYINDGKLHELTQSAQAPEVLGIMRHITNGVAFLHGHDQVHRDLKPRNGNSTLFPVINNSTVL